MAAIKDLTEEQFKELMDEYFAPVEKRSKMTSEEIKDLGITSLYVRIRAKTRNPAPGPGAHAIIKSLSRSGFKIINILDMTRVPRGGPKKKGGRRGRRP